MPFKSLELTEDVKIDSIITIHYFEYMSDYSFPGEHHDFWEFLCVDKGEVEVTADNRAYTLKKGEIIFHKPNEFHTVRANGKIAPNLVVISFDCTSPCMDYFEDLKTSIGELERNLIAKIIYEAKHCIKTPLNDPQTTEMERNINAPFGSEQLIKIYLQALLITMIRNLQLGQYSAPATKSMKLKNDDLLYNKITTYLEEHIREHLSIETICRDNLIGRSQLQKLFREHDQCGVIDYFSRLKVELAKQLIRENYHNFTQISEFIGYNSIHYFSRQFKKITGMTPSEYASSIKVISDRK